MANELAGVAELTQKLQALGKLDDGKIVRGAVRSGMGAARKEAAQRIPIGTDAFRTYTGRLVGPGFASRNLRLVTVLSADKQQATAMLGVSKEAYYAVQFVELGTSKMPAQPWLRPAFYGTKDEQLQRLANYMERSIVRIAEGGRP